MGNTITKESLAGAFFIVGIIAIVIIALVLGERTGLGESKYRLDVVFSDVGGLRVGAPVRVAGVNVGTVVNIEFMDNPKHPDKRVKVGLSILTKYKEEVDNCSMFSVKTEGLLGDKLIDIQLPKKDEVCRLLSKDEFIVGQDPLDIKNLADDFSETAKYFTYLSKEMTDMFRELRKMTITSKRILNRVEDRIIEGGLFNLFMGKDKK